MAAELELLNLALSRLGDVRLTTYPEPGTKVGRAVAAHWPKVRDEVLRAHSWNFATKRDRIEWVQKTVTGISNAAQAVVTSVAHGLAVGQFVRFAVAMAGMDGLIGQIESVPTDDTFAVDIDSSALAAYVAGPADTVTVVPGFEWANAYPEPTDCLRVLSVDGDESGEEWASEAKAIVTDRESPIQIRYIWRQECAAKYDAHFFSAAATRLATALCEELIQSPARKRELWDEYLMLLAQARRSDGREQTASEFTEDDWVNARLG